MLRRSHRSGAKPHSGIAPRGHARGRLSYPLITCTLSLAVWAAACGQTRDDEAARPGDGLLSLSLSMDQSVVTDDDRDAVVLVEMTAADVPVGEQQPVSLAIAMDASGSMEGPKIENAREAAHALVERLAVGDEITIVSYSQEAEVHLENYRVGANRSEAHAAIDEIEPLGNTCTSCGLSAAYLALAESDPSRLRRVVLLSDGHANVGHSDTTTLQWMAEVANHESGIETSTIGLGRLHNEGALADIAMGGRASYYFLHNSEYLATILDRELRDLHSTVLTELAVRLSPGDGVTFAGSPNIGVVWEGNDLVVPVGQLAVSEQRQFLVELNLPPGDMGRAVFARAEFRDAAGAPYELETSARLRRSSDVAEAEASIDSHVMAQAALVASARIVEQVMLDYENGNFEQAQDTLSQQWESLEITGEVYRNDELTDEADVLRELGATLEESPGPQSREGRGNVIFERARSNERRRGVPMSQSYHEPRMYDLSEIE